MEKKSFKHLLQELQQITKGEGDKGLLLPYAAQQGTETDVHTSKAQNKSSVSIQSNGERTQSRAGSHSQQYIPHY